MASSKPYRLVPVLHEKVWGSTQLEPWFPNSLKKTGEAWFWEQDSPILIKFLFTTANLSVQVHPNDRQAQELEPGCVGKTEMWHILKAQPGAKLAMGLTRTLTREELRSAALDGSIMDELRWVPAVPGDTWFIPAGTIHAIGAGITLTEVQQYSDVTYRLFDYGRPRELHLEKGIAVSDPGFQPQQAVGPVCCPYFHAEATVVQGDKELLPGLVVVMRGSGNLAGERVREGEVWRVQEQGWLSGEDCDILWVGEGHGENHHQS